MAGRIPQRKSSQNFSMTQPASIMALATPQVSSRRETTIRSRGKSTSPIRTSRTLLNLRRAPSRTFVPPVTPSDILDFPKVNHPRIAIDKKLSTPTAVGGATVEGEVYISIDGGRPSNRKKACPPISLRRIVVSLVGVEYSGRCQRIFRSLATDLVDNGFPPPSTMLAAGHSASTTLWEVLPSASVLPFRLDLPVIMGPPPYKDKRLGIKYVLSTTVEVSINRKAEFVRKSQEITVLTVHDRMYMRLRSG